MQTVVLFFSVLASLTLLLWQVSEMPRLTVADVVVEGNRGVAAWDVARIVEEHLARRFLWLFPRRNMFLVPRRAIAAAVQSEYPRVSALELSLQDGPVLRIVVSERKSIALVCPYPFADVVPVTPCLFTDTEGFLFAEAPRFSGHVILSYHDGEQRLEIGKTFLPDGEFERVYAFIQSLRILRTEPVAVSLATDMFTVHLRRGGKILVRRDNALPLIAENAKLILASPDFQKDVSPSLGNLDYVDLRFGNKVFYKVRE